MSISSSDNTSTAPTKPRFRFSLRTLLFGAALLAAAIGWVGHRWQRTQDRRNAILQLAARRDGLVQFRDGQFFGRYDIDGISNPNELEILDIWSEAMSVSIGSYRKPAQDSDLVALLKLQEVESLSLYGRRITNDGMDSLSRLTKLQALSLKNTSVTPEGLSAHENLRNLTLLAFWELSVTDSTLEGLESLPGLQHLQIIQAPNFTDSGLRHLSGLKSLRRLDIFRTPINGSGFSHIRKLELEQLRLNNTSIDNNCVVHLCQLTGLKELDIRATLIDDHGFVQIQRALPNCEINR